MQNRFSGASPAEDIAEALREDGYAIVEGLMHPNAVGWLRRQIEPHLGDTSPDAANAFMGERTKRFGRLLHRVPIVRTLIQHPAVLYATSVNLRPLSPTFQVHFTGVMHVMEGEKAQVLHRDISPFPNPGPTVVIATMWAASDFTRENGATVFAPGSHKWPDSRAPKRSELTCAEMPAGSVLLYAGNLVHGAGACKTGSRTGVALQYCVGWMRQEENQYLAVPLEVAKTFDSSLQLLMGYDLAAQHWGYVDQEHPMDFLNQDGGHRSLDPDGYAFQDRVAAMHVTVDGLHISQRYAVTLDD